MARRVAVKERPVSSGPPLTQVVYDAVRDAIEQGEFNPGDRISEYRIAAWLQISRTPAREGLLRLEVEGILAQHPRRGLIVAVIDSIALRELFLAREVLERALAGEAAQNASRPEIDAILHLTELEAEMEGDRARMYQHNKVFHQQVRLAAHNRYLYKYSLTLDDVVAGDRRGSSLVDPARRDAVVVEHLEIAQAIAARDVARAEAAATQHIRAAYRARSQVPQPTAAATG